MEGTHLWMRKQLKSVITYNSRVIVERWNNRGLLRNIRADSHRPVIQTGFLLKTLILFINIYIKCVRFKANDSYVKSVLSILKYEIILVSVLCCGF